MQQNIPKTSSEMAWVTSITTVLALTLTVRASHAAPPKTTEPKPSSVYYNLPRQSDGSLSPNPLIANGAAFGKLVGVYFTSGTGPAARNTAADSGTPERYIDPAFFPTFVPPAGLPDGVSITEAQAYNCLARIKENLEAQGLSLKDVIYLRVYLDNPPGSNVADYAGWNDAYRQFFANVNLANGSVSPANPVYVNPTRPARTTLEVASLPVTGWLIEIEAVATYAGK